MPRWRVSSTRVIQAFRPAVRKQCNCCLLQTRRSHALLLSASGSHAFLLNLGETDDEEWVAIKSGFAGSPDAEMSIGHRVNQVRKTPQADIEVLGQHPETGLKFGRPFCGCADGVDRPS